MYAEERRAAIAEEARRAGRVRVADLAERFEVAPETIRRDLDVLAEGGALRRVHGGAIPVDDFDPHEATLTDREVKNAAAKQAIAAAAMTYVPQRDGTIILDAGSTTNALATCLLQPGPITDLSVVTNSVPAALTLTSTNQHTVLLLGGTVRPVTRAAVGPTTLEQLGRVRVDVVFLGTNGLSEGFGLTTPDAAEAAVKRGMVSAARTRVVLADRTKFGHDFFVRFAALKDIDVLVTDAKPTGSLASALSAHQIEVVVA